MNTLIDGSKYIQAPTDDSIMNENIKCISSKINRPKPNFNLASMPQKCVHFLLTIVCHSNTLLSC